MNFQATSRLIPTLLFTLMLCACSGMQAPLVQKSLYQRLGGQCAIQEVVDDFIGNVAADARINGFFAHTNIAHLNEMLVAQICQATGGPCTYTGRSMKAAHAGMGVQGSHFNALMEDLAKSLNKFSVPQKEQNELLGALAAMKGDIVAH
jgi:hemoglobin